MNAESVLAAVWRIWLQLRGLSQPQFRLRVGDIRVFYDVTEATVEILALVEKSEAQAWLDDEGRRTSGRDPR